MLIMTSIIRVGQSRLVSVPIDEDSNERIMNCLQTLSELQEVQIVHEIFLDDTKKAFERMLTSQEVSRSPPDSWMCAYDSCCQKRAAEKKEAESVKKVDVQVDDVLSFRQFSKKAEEAIDVSSVCLFGHPVLGLIFGYSTMKMSAKRLVLARFKKTSCLT